MKRGVNEIDWSALRAEYIARGPRNMRAFAEQHDVAYRALVKRVKGERWQHAHDRFAALSYLRRCEAELEWARGIARAAAERVLKKASSTRSLEKVAHLAQDAGSEITHLWSAACWVEQARRELAIVEQGQPRGHVGAVFERASRPFPRFPGSTGRTEARS